MQKIEYVDGFKVINKYPDYTPEEKERADEILLEKLYNIFFHDEDKSK